MKKWSNCTFWVQISNSLPSKLLWVLLRTILEMPELLQIYTFCFLTGDIAQCSAYFAPSMQWAFRLLLNNTENDVDWKITSLTESRLINKMTFNDHKTSDLDLPIATLTDQQWPWLTLTVASREPDTTTECVKSTECTTLVWQRWQGSR